MPGKVLEIAAELTSNLALAGLNQLIWGKISRGWV